MLQQELETAIALARVAGKAILERYDTGFETEEKISEDNFREPVTIADREASQIIVDGLSRSYPDDAILSEEEPDDIDRRLSGRRVWIVDPIDGTAGFVKHDGDFGIQIGLAVDGRPVLGVVFVPVHESLSYAVKGGGSFSLDKDGRSHRRRVSNRENFNEMTLAVSRNHLGKRMDKIVEVFGFENMVRRGSVGLKVGLIVDKASDIYIHPSPRTKLWDTCAPHIILEEAGGKFTDLFGSEIGYDRSDLQNRNGILATNGASHSKAVAKLVPLLAEFGRSPYIYPR